ncbi:MAG TPA: hypothetical protein ENG63_02350 [Candidatus Desulfofervidus auxilii]|uniref:Uncharacterized protein n=1 Tax=Desulfofervidus auxilii TaxID=1621989 RepID=A0A7C0Y4U5_DESA2|nr:hypothetical protein [Candidatus Desulfofervidus auxilii]
MKKIPLNFLNESGLLFEINRKILHPFGFSLKLNNNNIELWSYEDLEVYYNSDTFIKEKTKFNNFLNNYGKQKLRKRKKKLGFVIQTNTIEKIEFPNEKNKKFKTPEQIKWIILE